MCKLVGTLQNFLQDEFILDGKKSRADGENPAAKSGRCQRPLTSLARSGPFADQDSFGPLVKRTPFWVWQKSLWAI